MNVEENFFMMNNSLRNSWKFKQKFKIQNSKNFAKIKNTTECY